MSKRLGSFLRQNTQELIFLVGLGLLSAGLAQISVPLAMIVPGAILVWLAIPPTPRVKE